MQGSQEEMNAKMDNDGVEIAKGTATPSVKRGRGRLVVICAVVAGIGFAGYLLWERAPSKVRSVVAGLGHYTPRIPACVLATDYQSPLDAKLLEPLLEFDRTGVSQKIDANVLKPLLDDTVTIKHTMSSVEITENQFPDRPELQKMICDCARILGVKKPRVFVTDGPGLNAFTCNFTDPIIVLHASLLRRYVSDHELYFIIGHEMGHIRCSHVKWHTMIREVARAILPEKVAAVALFPVLKWFRESEFSADNAGLLCCQDVATAECALMRMELGLSEGTIGRINVDEYLKQRQRADFSMVAEGVQLWREILREHPFTPDRIRQLREYAATDRYKAVWDRKVQ